MTGRPTHQLQRLVPDPTSDEYHRHCITHTPFKAWCPHCVAGEAPALQHIVARNRSIPTKLTVHVDYLFLSGEVDLPSESPVVVVKVKPTNAVYARLLPCKGTAHRYCSNALSDIFKHIGAFSFHLKSDDEPALTTLLDAAISQLGSNYIITTEKSADSQQNGVVERANRSVQGKCRVLLSCLSSRLGCLVPDGHPLIAWAVRHASALIRWFTVNRETGYTAHHITTGRTFKNILVEFAQPVYHKHPFVPGKTSPKWADGFFLGVCERSGRNLVYDDVRKTVLRTRNIRTKTTTKTGKWNDDHITALLSMKSLPWNWTGEGEASLVVPGVLGVIPEPQAPPTLS